MRVPPWCADGESLDIYVGRQIESGKRGAMPEASFLPQTGYQTGCDMRALGACSSCVYMSRSHKGPASCFYLEHSLSLGNGKGRLVATIILLGATSSSEPEHCIPGSRAT